MHNASKWKINVKLVLKSRTQILTVVVTFDGCSRSCEWYTSMFWEREGTLTAPGVFSIGNLNVETITTLAERRQHTGIQ